jgi:hypothetical protein
MSLKNAFKFVGDELTAFEGIAALALGLVSGLKLPAYIESGLMRAGVPSNYVSWMTSGSYTPYLAGAATTALLGYALMGVGVINPQTAHVIAAGGVAINALNLVGSMTSYVPQVGLGGYTNGGYLGNAHVGGSDMMAYDSFDARSFGMDATPASSMFGASSRNLNFY